MKYKSLLGTIAGMICVLYVSGQGTVATKSSPGVSWTINPYDHKAFIENRGQFDAEVSNSDKVLFHTMLGNIKLYFTAKGLIYRYDKQQSKDRIGEDATEGAEDRNTLPPEIHYAKMEWEDANPKVNIDTKEMQPDYYMYEASDKSTIQANAFKKITYRNLYPGIDVEYSFPEGKDGIEYTFIVHPGADMSVVKMKYDGMQTIESDNKGDISMAMILPHVTNIIEHAPKAYYSDTKEPITSSFSVKDNVVSFTAGNYDKSREVAVDPWTINPVFTNLDNAYDIASDAAGNVYSFGGGGGGSNWLLKKFTAAGAPVWTFTTAYNQWFGALATDPAGNSYLTYGCCGGGIEKISTGGAVTWSVNNGVYEYWLLAFDITGTNLYLGCGYSSGAIPAESISNINMGTGAITGAVVLNSGGSEPRSMACSPSNKNIYFLTSTVNDVIGITPGFAGIFSVPNGYALAYNGPTYADGSNPTSGQNGIAAGKSFIATSNGATLMRRNMLTGALMGSIAIPGGVVEGNSGVLIDGCGHIYVGSQNAVYEYDSLLNPITNVATVGAVYDIQFGGSGVLASGNGFISNLSFVICPVVLPIRLQGFTCHNTSKGIEIEWETSTETNNKFFTVQRSVDGIEFTDIASIAGAGNSQTSRIYSYLDTAARNGDNYYRLLQTDFDGNSETFQTTVCDYNAAVNGFSIYPNPASGVFSLTLAPSASEQIMNIYDMLGRTIYSETFPVSNTYITHTIDLSGKPKGVYFINVFNGQTNTTGKLCLY